MISDIRSRIATIENRIGLRPTSAVAPATNSTGSSPENSAGLLQSISAPVSRNLPGVSRTGTLADMWASASSRAHGFSATPAVPRNYTGSVPAGADRYRATFEAAGARYGVDPDLLAAVAWTESGFQADAVSHAGAIGLMQIMPGTAEGLGVDPRDPVQAIDGAARYLRQQMDRFGDTRLALAAYNAGPGAVEKYGGVPPYDETVAYVGKVLGRYDQMRSLQ